MERQVLEASFSLVRTGTSPQNRSQASSTLEQWTRTDDAATWQCFVDLVRISFAIGEGGNSSALDQIALEGSGKIESTSSDAISVRLLILTMLHSKIRREYSKSKTLRSNPCLAVSVGNEIGSALAILSQSLRNEGTIDANGTNILNHLCHSAAAIAVRSSESNSLRSLVDASHSALVTSPESPSVLSPLVALFLLSYLPEEIQSSERTSPEIDEMLQSLVGIILDCVCGAFAENNVELNRNESFFKAGLRVLKNWSETAKITLSQLHAKTGMFSGGCSNFLTFIIQILSQHIPTSEEIIIIASGALQNVVTQTLDSGTETREKSVTFMLSSIADLGFLIAPFIHAQQRQWDGAAHAIASLASTFAIEEVDEIASFPSKGVSQLTELLLQIQSHPSHSVAVTALEFWLAVQDIPTAERHPDWGAPLFCKVLDILVSRVAYNKEFTTWEDEYEIDSQEFEEMRRLASDVLVSIYFLLRIRFIDQVIAMIQNSHVSENHWCISESALFCLSSVGRDVCARLNTRGGGDSVISDIDATKQSLTQFVKNLCTGGIETAARQHPLVLSGISVFIGSYAVAWNICCETEVIFDLLTYLKFSMNVPIASLPAAKSIRQICVSATNIPIMGLQFFSTGLQPNPLESLLSETIETALKTGNEEVMGFVAEGLTRITVKLKDSKAIRYYLNSVVSPVIFSIQQSLGMVRSERNDISEFEMAKSILASHLLVLKEVIRFSEGSGTEEPLHDFLSALWPTLNEIGCICHESESITTNLLSLHCQLLNSVPKIVFRQFTHLVSFVVKVYEESHSPFALEYIAISVESFGSEAESSFIDLLKHLCTCTCSFLQHKKPNECTQMISAFFDMIKRALVANQELLGTLISLAVACLDACGGERESTRAALVFLSQLIGWKSLRLSHTLISALEEFSDSIDYCVSQNGESLAKACIIGLSGGAPQMLWPGYSDCLFALISNTNPNHSRHWVISAMTSINSLEKSEVLNKVMEILFRYAKAGTKAKPKAKMLLTDYAKICNGDMTADAIDAHGYEY